MILMFLKLVISCSHLKYQKSDLSSDLFSFLVSYCMTLFHAFLTQKESSGRRTRYHPQMYIYVFMFRIIHPRVFSDCDDFIIPVSASSHY
jgi:hypothetical protein